MLDIKRKLFDTLSWCQSRFSSGDETKHLALLFFTAIVVTFVLYGVFYRLTPYIWSLNQTVVSPEVAPAIRIWLHQKDGIETYVLYALVLLNIAVMALLLPLLRRIKISSRVFWPVLLATTFVVLIYFRRRVGFNPPLEERASFWVALTICLATTLGLWLWSRIARWRRRVGDILMIVALLPICFIASGPMSLFDYAYVFAPALRLVNGAEFSGIYFQYDLWLSLLAAGWLKFKIAIDLFPVLGQLSVYALFVAGFFLARRFFRDPRLAYGLLATLILMKVYAPVGDSVTFLQVTPLRLELWLVLFAIGYEKGIYSKWLGAALGALAVFHRAFGLIYVASYLELLAVLWLLDLIRNRLAWRELLTVTKRHLAIAGFNLVAIAIALVLSSLIFGGVSLEAASLYRKIGIGFLPTYHQSFYWYVPIVLSVACALLIQRRQILSERYFHVGLFLVLLTVGNSLYFFGRSHEHNIINIAAPLLFALFLMFDLVFSGDDSFARSKWGMRLATSVPFILVLAIAFFYSGRITDKLTIQAKNLAEGRGVYRLEFATQPELLKDVLGGSTKVYFLSNNDFAYYYYWGYVPQGRFTPYNAWVFKKDVLGFLQGLVDDGYYLVVPEAEMEVQSEILSGLRYSYETVADGFWVVWR